MENLIKKSTLLRHSTFLVQHSAVQKILIKNSTITDQFSCFLITGFKELKPNPLKRKKTSDFLGLFSVLAWRV